MKTIFKNSDLSELLTRIDQLESTDRPQWGKMNPFQAATHCRKTEEMFQGSMSMKRLFIGRLIGAMILKKILKNEDPLPLNQPTHPMLRINADGDLIAEKQHWVRVLNAYAGIDSIDMIHPLFGKMNKEQIGRYVYKHTDHHLRQFGR